jgi:hypothetical protein
MRYRPLPSSVAVAALLFSAVTLLPIGAGAQSQAPATPPAPATQEVPPGPYKPVPITLPKGLNDTSFDAFRNQLNQIAKKKDRAGLAKLVSSSFFWMPEDSDLADKGKPAIDNLARAFNLDSREAFGWDSLVAYAEEKTAMPDPQRQGVFCAPAEPGYDDNAAAELATATHTIASDWMYPVREGVEVRSTAKRDAPVTERLGLYLVRVLPDDAAGALSSGDFHKVMTPTGKVGFVGIDALRDISEEQLCYVKEGGAWKIAGFYGGEATQ